MVGVSFNPVPYDFVDPSTGQLSRPARRFLLDLYERTGGTTDTVASSDERIDDFDVDNANSFINRTGVTEAGGYDTEVQYNDNGELNGADIKIVNIRDLELDATTGSRIGTATSQKLAFWNAVPIIQPAAANQAALTNNTGGVYDGTLAAVSGSGDDTTINNNFTDLHTLLNEVRTALANAGIIKGSA